MQLAAGTFSLFQLLRRGQCQCQRRGGGTQEIIINLPGGGQGLGRS